MITSLWWGKSYCFFCASQETITRQWSSVFECKCSGKWIADEICSMHLLLLCEVLTMVSYLRMESLLVLYAEVTPLGAKVQSHATQRRGAGFIERTWAVQGEKVGLFNCLWSHWQLNMWLDASLASWHLEKSWLIMRVGGLLADGHKIVSNLSHCVKAGCLPLNYIMLAFLWKSYGKVFLTAQGLNSSANFNKNDTELNQNKSIFLKRSTFEIYVFMFSLLIYLWFLEISLSLEKEFPGYDGTLYRQCIKRNTIGNTDPSSENP